MGGGNSQSGTITHTFTENGESTLTFQYSKDGSVDTGDDLGRVTDIVLTCPGEPSVMLDKDSLNLFAVPYDNFCKATILLALHGVDANEITWKSSDEAVATVADGVISAVAEGDAVITASATVDEKTYTADCKVKVTGFAPDQTVVYSESAGNLASLISEEARDTITKLVVLGNLSANDLDVLRQMAGRNGNGSASNGKLTELDLSYADWSTYYNGYDGSNEYNFFFSACDSLKEIKLPKNVYQLHKDEEAVTPCTVYADKDKKITLSPFADVKAEDIAWSSSNDSIASVVDGIITAMSAGEAVITATAVVDSIPYTAECRIKVSDFAPSQTVVFVNSPGTLPSLISEEARDTITNLVVLGNINSSDISVLKYMAGRDDNNSVTAGILQKLDMGNAMTHSSIFFQQCNSIQEIVLPEKTSECYFNGCSNLRKVILNKELDRLGDFRETKVDSLFVPASVASIGSYAFQNLSSLKAITFEEGSKLTSIGDWAFLYCSNLKSFSLPGNVSAIASSTFNSCYSLEEFIVPADSKLTTISDCAFQGCSKLKSITLPASLKTITNQAFQGCRSLETVDFADGSKLTSIGEEAFGNCSNLKSFSLPVGVVTLQGGCFSWCSALAEFNISKDSKISAIGQNVFGGCSALTSFTLPNTVTTLGSECFANSGLKELNISKDSKISAIGQNVFNGCSALTSFTLPNTVTTLGSGCFASSGLKELNISKDSKLVTVGQDAFNGCSFTSLYIPQLLTDISSTGFNNNYLKEITVNDKNTAYTAVNGVLYSKTDKTLLAVPKAYSGIYTTPDFLTTIPAGAFSGCHALRSVILSEKITSVADNAFDGCSSIKSLHSLATKAPTVTESTFNGLNTNIIPVFVMSDALEGYKETAWGTFALLSAYPQAPSVWMSENSVKLYDTKFEETRSKDITAVALTPQGPSSAEIKWTVGDTTVVKVTDGHIDLVAPGQTTITASALINGREISQQCDVNVKGFAAGQHVLYVRAGNLSNLISEEERNTITNLTLFGEIDGSDVYVLRNMTNKNSGGKLASLDMSEVRVVAGGSWAYTKDNAFTGSAFRSANALVEIKLPKTLTSLGNYTFESCYNLERVTMPENITKIEPYTFYNCSKLKTDNIDVNWDNITEYGQGAFYCGDSLNVIHVSSPVLAKYVEINEGSSTSLINTNSSVVVVPAALLDAYRNADGWKDFYQQIVPDDAQLNVTAEVTAKDDESGLRQVVGEKQLSYVTDLKLSGTINSYDLMILRNKMPNLHKLDLTETAIVANNYEFVTGSHTENDALSSETFKGQTKLYDIKLPKGITSIGYSAFYGCSNIKEIEIPKTVTSIGGSAFYNCYGIRNMVIPDAVSYIGEWAFYDCRSLKSVTLPSHLESIGNYTFYNCYSLESIAIPTNVKSIGNNAFYGCSSLTEVRIPPMLETVSGGYEYNGSFRDCSNIKKVYTYIANANDVNIGQYAFDCWSTATLYVPKFASSSYYWNTQWSQFAKIEEFDEPYEKFYTAGDITLDKETGSIPGTPDSEVKPGGGLGVDDINQDLGNVDLGSDGEKGSSLIVSGSGEINAKTITIKLNVTGHTWHAFCFPFDIPLDSIKYSGDFVWRKYDGDLRAAQKSGWANLEAETKILKKGEGYIFQGNVSGELVITIKKPELTAKDIVKNLFRHDSKDAKDAGWNFIGNPYPSYFKVTENAYEAPVTVWRNGRYEAYRPGDDDFSFQPFQAFFVQTGDDRDCVDFNATQRMTYLQTKASEVRAESRRQNAKVNPSRLFVNLELSEAGDTTCVDKSRVVFNNARTTSYESSCDATKFDNMNQGAQIYTLDASGTKYAINERPVEQGIVPLGIKTKKEGTYAIAAARMDNSVSLIDYETGVTHDLSLGAYEFTASAGDINKRFALKLNQTPTSIEQFVEKTGIDITLNGGVTIGNVADGTVTTLYTLGGSCVGKLTGAGTITASAGTYILNVGAMSVKVAVK